MNVWDRECVDFVCYELLDEKEVWIEVQKAMFAISNLGHIHTNMMMRTCAKNKKVNVKDQLPGPSNNFRPSFFLYFTL